MLKTKQQLYAKSIEILATKIRELERMINSINDSKNNETKSSAGDKFETGRAMMQMEEDKVTAQLELAKHAHNQLLRIDVEQNFENIHLGCLVKTKLRSYFLSVALGKIMINGNTYYCISLASPIGQQMLGKTVGDRIEFNGVKDVVMELI